MMVSVESQSALSGVFPVLSSPFSESNTADPEGLKRLVAHILEVGADGIVYPAVASEFRTLSGAERTELVETVFDAVGGHMPVIVGVSAPTPEESAALVEQAKALGAAAFMIMPPSELGADLDLILKHMQPPAEMAGDIPIILQNAPPPMGPGLAVELMCRIVKNIAQIQYIKEETLPSGERISQFIAESIPTLVGIFGGAGGRFIMDELNRGVIGSMPACEFTEIHRKIFDLYRDGKKSEARTVYNRLLPLLNFESVFRAAATKEILARRGIIESARHRHTCPSLDDADKQELDAILLDIEDLWITTPTCANF